METQHSGFSSTMELIFSYWGPLLARCNDTDGRRGYAEHIAVIRSHYVALLNSEKKNIGAQHVCAEDEDGCSSEVKFFRWCRDLI